MMLEKVNLIVNYKAQNVRKIPDLSITILGKEYSIPNNRSLTITIDKGEYDIVFKIPFLIKAAKVNHHVSLDSDMQIDVGWSKMWGKITIKDVITHVTL